MKTLKDIQDRILNLESRQKDGLDTDIEIEVLKELEDIRKNFTDDGFFGSVHDLGMEFFSYTQYKKAAICIWALE